jgi:hypothetical protein
MFRRTRSKCADKPFETTVDETPRFTRWHGPNSSDPLELLYLKELLWVLDPSPHPLEGSGLETEHEKGIRRRIEGRLNPEWLRRLKAESRVIAGVPEHDDDAVPEVASIRETSADQSRAYPSSLPCGQHRHGSEGEAGMGDSPSLTVKQVKRMCPTISSPRPRPG